ncbi:MAG TPA: VirB4 family type IV secretion/conjugal transfer ATPase, partial [Polyangiaceae bacterium]|nr:VirB4 family type IV secretion/conjugal transfer ATPase [Polyangiaceae bacterium]
RSIGSPNVAVWTHLIRHRDHSYPAGKFNDAFAACLNAHYRERIAGERLMRNDLYLSLVYRPTSGAATGLTARFLTRSRPEGLKTEIREAIDACEKLRETVVAALAAYEPDVLGLYQKDRHCYSRVLEFLSHLIDGESRPVPLPRAPLHRVLGTSRPSFGLETLEFRTATHARLGAMLGIKEYATPSAPGMFNGLLSAPFPLILTQSFSFLKKAASQSLLVRQYNQLTNAGDFARSQAEELKTALDALTSGEFVIGDHHLTLLVLADAVEDARPATDAWRLKALNDRVAQARDLLADAHIVVAREDLALEEAYWGQLPGAFNRRPRKAPITSRNFAGMSPFHNYATGRSEGNHWGEATTVFVSSAGSAYHYGPHASDPDDPDGGSRKDIGHTLVCGPTGSGKTVLIGFLIAMLTRQNTTQIVLDKDRGLQILVRALHGEYLPLRNGIPTGFNPLQLDATPANLQFLKTWLRALAQPAGAPLLGVREQADLDQALHGTLALPRPHRRLSRLVEFLDATDPEGVFGRLSPWCAGGDEAWVFDNPEDVIVPLLERNSLIGFDGTDFLANDLTRPPVTLYIFHLVRQLLDGRRLVFWVDEFARWLADAAFAAMSKDSLQTMRKLEGCFMAAVQSASNVRESAIARTIVEQTATKILFPTSDATREDYIDLFGLSEREYRLIKEELSPGSRCFLVKRGRHSAVCQLDLKGFDAELAVISGRATSVELLNQLIAQHGPAPEEWLAPFCEHFGGLPGLNSTNASA